MRVARPVLGTPASPLPYRPGRACPALPTFTPRASARHRGPRALRESLSTGNPESTDLELPGGRTRASLSQSSNPAVPAWPLIGVSIPMPPQHLRLQGQDCGRSATAPSGKIPSVYSAATSPSQPLEFAMDGAAVPAAGLGGLCISSRPRSRLNSSMVRLGEEVEMPAAAPN